MSISKKLMTTGATDVAYVEDVFSTYLYEATGGYSDIVNGIDLAGEGGMVWSKSRSQAFDHGLTDTERGVAGGLLQPHESYPAQVAPEGLDLTSYNSNGYSFGPKYTASYNQVGDDYVSWTFRKAPSFFDVVTYTGTGVAREIPHNLGVEPGMVIVKSLDKTYKWIVSHRSLANLSEYLVLNDTDAKNADANVFGSSSDSHTADAFRLGSDSYGNQMGDEYVAYLFAHDDSDEGLIQCGSYTGNQTAGKQIDLGFEPQFVLIKASSGTGEWYMFDTMRGIVNGGLDPFLRANMNAAESGAYEQLEVNPTGFSLSADTNVNTNGVDYIFMAIRRPNKPVEEFEADELFATSPRTDGPGKYPFFSDFPVDMGMMRTFTDPQSVLVGSRLQGGRVLQTAEKDPEYEDSNWAYDAMKSAALAYKTTSNPQPKWMSWMWRRAPGFFDVVTFRSEGSRTTEYPHNLQVAPEMVWVKSRKTTFNWHVWHKDLTGPGWSLMLNDHLEERLTDTGTAASGRPPPTYTDTYFTTGGEADAGGSSAQDYTAYLFASVPGVCDIGSYTGTGTTQDIDCGFTNGARWFMIKRTDQPGDWYYTSQPGSPEFLLKFNNTDAQMNYSSTFTVPQGFRVRSTLGDINVDGGKYIYMAIA